MKSFRNESIEIHLGMFTVILFRSLAFAGLLVVFAKLPAMARTPSDRTEITPLDKADMYSLISNLKLAPGT
jgi:hypothetical protein